jgi:hypothetical protein
MFPKTTKFSVYVFDTLALANASTIAFGFGKIIMIKGDNTRFKLGGGITLSFDTPVAPTAQTFAQLPWYSGQASFGNAYAAPATATLTAAQLMQKYIITTSAAATSLTLPTAALLGAALGATQGFEFEFEIDNSGGSNIVTVVVGTGIVAATPALTGGATLTVAAGTFGKFKIIFKTPNAGAPTTYAALIFRTL